MIKNIKILIVDDDPTFLKLVKDKISKVKKYSILIAKDGDEGMHIALIEKPRVIVLDLIMPRMDGIEFLKQLRGNLDEKISSIPVIVLTQISDMKKIEEATRYNIFGYIVKSDMSLDDVVTRVQEAATTKK